MGSHLVLMSFLGLWSSRFILTSSTDSYLVLMCFIVFQSSCLAMTSFTDSELVLTSFVGFQSSLIILISSMDFYLVLTCILATFGFWSHSKLILRLEIFICLKKILHFYLSARELN